MATNNVEVEISDLLRALPGRQKLDRKKLLRPYDRHSAPPKSMSAHTGYGAQPLHTDGAHQSVPPRYVFLHCLNSGERPCSTIVWTLNVKALEKTWPTALAHHCWLIERSASERFYGYVLERTKFGLPRIRFDPCCMTPLSTLIDPAAVYDAFGECKILKTLVLTAGDVILLDNWRVLHGRGPGSENSPSRLLERWTSRTEHGLGE
jgi:hypothetical protein